jgi:hypothetical protein
MLPLLAVFSAPRGRCQQPLPPGSAGAGMPGGSATVFPAPEPADPFRRHLIEEQQRSWNAERQRHLLEDAARLEQLAGELRQELARTDKDTLSLSVLRKSAQIEKLARGIGDRERATLAVPSP